MGAIVSCMSNVMYITEKISLWLTCTGLICCLVLTITVCLGMGIGLGYNYCFVGTKSKHKHVMGRYVYPPGHPACCANYQREGEERQRAQDNQNMDAMSEENALRMPPQLPDYETRLNHSDTFGVPAEYPYFANPLHTGDKTDDYHPIFSDSESLNEKESGVETIVGLVTNDDSTDISENNPETHYIAKRTSSIFPIVTEATEKRKDMLELNKVISSYSESSKRTASTTEGLTEILSDTSEPPPQQIETTTPLANDPSSRKEKKLVIPISGLDLISILSKLSDEKKNYSLQILTT